MTEANLYRITDEGCDYIALENLNTHVPLIGSAEIIDYCFQSNNFEIDGVQYTSAELTNQQKMDIYLGDGFIVKHNNEWSEEDIDETRAMLIICDMEYSNVIAMADDIVNGDEYERRDIADTLTTFRHLEECIIANSFSRLTDDEKYRIVSTIETHSEMEIYNKIDLEQLNNAFFNK